MHECEPVSPPAGSRLTIPAGLGLSVLGAAGVSLLVLGVSELYVARYSAAVTECAGAALALGVFFTCYGRFLDHLEARAVAARPVAGLIAERGESRNDEIASSSGNPVSANVIVGIAGTANGLVIACAGLIWTQGVGLLLNLLAGALLTLASTAVWWFGRPKMQI